MLNKLNCLLIAALFFYACSSETDNKYRQTIAAHRMQINASFFDPTQTPLDSNVFSHFTGIKFFPINAAYKVTAKLEPFKDTSIFELLHSHNASKPYRNYAMAIFELNGKSYSLKVLEAAVHKKGYENYLLIPFMDETNSEETYGGGRYIDIEKPASGESKSEEIEIDFNLAYNPYCAYNSSYTCPIPPKENNLATRIEAGMKYDAQEFEIVHPSGKH